MEIKMYPQRDRLSLKIKYYFWHITTIEKSSGLNIKCNIQIHNYRYSRRARLSLKFSINTGMMFISIHWLRNY